MFCVSGGLGHHVVFKVAEDYLDKNHHLFFDNYFNSVVLQEELLKRSTYSCGTIRVNRKDWPKDLVFNQRTPKAKRLKAGETRVKQKGDMVATVWQDKRTVAVLSTGIESTMGSAVRARGNGKNSVFTRSINFCLSCKTCFTCFLFFKKYFCKIQCICLIFLSFSLFLCLFQDNT